MHTLSLQSCMVFAASMLTMSYATQPLAAQARVRAQVGDNVSNTVWYRFGGTPTGVQGSPTMPMTDGVWTPGESPLAADTGGYWPFNNGTPTLGTHVQMYMTADASAPPEGWYAQILTMPLGDVQVVRLRGYFRPSAIAADVPVDDGAFEILMSSTYDASLPTVILITNTSTFSGGADLPHYGRGNPEDRGKFAYQGWTSHSGLPFVGANLPPNQYPGQAHYSAPPANGVWAAGNLLAANYVVFGGPYNLICARAVPRMMGRPQVHIVQRDVELVRTIKQILQQNPSTSAWHPAYGSHRTGRSSRRTR